MGVYSREQLISLIQDYAWGAGIEPAIAIAQLDRESAHFADNVVYGPRTGTSGERGLAQFMPGTWADFGVGSFDKAFDPDYALTAWGSYMTYLLNLFDWDYSKALMGYNGGPGNVQRGTVSAGAQRYAREILQRAGADIPAGNDPFAEGNWTNWLTIGVIGAALLLVAKR